MVAVPPAPLRARRRIRMKYSKCPECGCEIDISDCDDTGVYECPKCEAWLSTDYTKRGHRILVTVYKKAH